MRNLRSILFATAVFGGVVAGACDDPLSLAPAGVENVVDTVTLYALRGTDVTKPSGYFLPTRSAVRTDQPGFDVAFDISDGGTPTLYPAGALGLTREPGLLKVTASFGDVTSAPINNDYNTIDPLPIPVGTVFVARSASYGGDCLLTALPRYGKFHVLAVDPVARSVTLEVLVDPNCGYRELRPGVPTA